MGIGYTPGMVKKGTFFSGIKRAVRNFSSGAGSIAARRKKSLISRPILMFAKPSEEALDALQRRAGTGPGTPPEARAFGSIGAAQDDADAASLALHSTPTSSAGHTDGTASIPRQRADFGPARALGVAPQAPQVAAVSPGRTPRAVVRSAGKGKEPERVQAHGRGRSADTARTGSSGERELELEEAVIATASRAASVRRRR